MSSKKDKQKMKNAVVLLCEKNNLILSVSRKNNQKDFGLPGGKVDGKESLIDALKREVKEETGLEIINAKQVFRQNDGEFIVTTFVADVSGDIETSESGIVKWCSKDELIAGSFGSYNKSLFNYLKELKNE